MPETPILDLDQSPPEPPATMVPIMVGLAIGAVLVGILILAKMGKMPDWSWPRANGLLFTKSGRNWVFRFDRHRWLGGFFQPLSPDVDLPLNRYALCVAGGPIASDVFLLLCWWLRIQYGNGERDWIGSLFWVPLLTVLLAVIPMTAGLNKSDSARLWQLIRYPERARAWIALLAIQSEDANGVRPRDWSPETFQQMMQADAFGGEFLSCQFLAYYRCLDEGAETRALDHLENALAKSGRAEIALRHAPFLEAASASAMIRKQAAQARTWCERACKLREPVSLEVINAGIAMCEERYPDAVQHWEAAQDFVDRRRLDSGLVRAVSRAAQV